MATHQRRGIYPSDSYHFAIAPWSTKEAESAAVKQLQATLAIVAAFSASIVFADDFKTVNGKEYKNASVIRIEQDGIVLKTKTGISKVYFVDLSHDVRERFGNRDPAEVEAECVARITKEWREKD